MDGGSSAKWKVRSTLREATGPIHERLHRARPFVAIADQQLDLAGYSDLLAQMAAFHFTVGQKLERGVERRNMLLRDLEALGSPVLKPVRWNSPTTGPGALGVAYVVEGSSLGGKVIYRQLDYLFGHSAAGRHFFRGTALDGQRWQALCRKLEAEEHNPGAIEEMINGAASAFAFFEQLISRWGGRD
jgi:heme oxygenase